MRAALLAAIVLGALAGLAGCSTTAPRPRELPAAAGTAARGLDAPSSPAPSPSPGQAGRRTLDEMIPRLTNDLTPDMAERFFGPPDEVTGSGLVIYVYRLDDGRKVWLGVPGNAPALYARLQALDGTTADLPLRDAGAVTANPSPTPSSTGEAQSASGDFAIYVNDQAACTNRPPTSATGVPASDDNPILSSGDIVTYTWQTHEASLTTAAYERIQQLRPPTSGMPFVVCVGTTPIYRGAFWPLYSSQSFDGIVIQEPLMKKNVLRIGQGYPSADFFRGPDPRADPRIEQALRRAGKLE